MSEKRLKNWKPERLSIASLEKELYLLSKKGVEVVDNYLTMLREVFLLRNPQFRFTRFDKRAFNDFVKEHLGRREFNKVGNWFYFSWMNKVVHYLPEDMHQELRTGRNRNLITQEEQDKYYNSIVGILGMSVGSHVALTIAMTGGAKCMKLADPDVISGSNLNRIRMGFSSVGINKAVAVARQIMEINPYAKLEVLTRGINDRNVEKYLYSPKLDLLVEEMDNPYFKLRVRELARLKGIPVIMAADNGDGVIVDVERYDQDKTIPILHGIMGETTSQNLKNLTPLEIPAVVAKMAGADRAHLRMLQSVLEVGKTLYSWPQLGTAASLCGIVLSYLTRQILTQQEISSGRYEVNLDSIFLKNYNTEENEMARTTERNNFLNALMSQKTNSKNK